MTMAIDPREEMEKKTGPVVAMLKEIEIRNGELNRMYHATIDGGQRLRAALVMLGCEAVGGESERAVAGAAAIELMHKFTLVHDDLIDQEDYRRGRRSFYDVFGSKYAIIMGDFLISMSFRMLKNLLTDHAPRTVLECSRILSDCLNDLCMGELKDCLFEDRVNVTIEQYIQMVEGKTASLMENALKIGTVLGEGDGHKVEKLSDFGRHFGVAFQIQNDINNLVGLEEKTGRKRGFDVYKKKKTPMVIWTLHHGSANDKRRLLRAFTKNEYSRTAVDPIIKMLEENGSMEYAMGMVKDYIGKAKNSIQSLKESRPKEILLGMTDYMETDTYWKVHSKNGN